MAHHLFQIADVRQLKILNDHCALHVLELNKWRTADALTKEPLTAEDQWMLFSATPSTGQIYLTD